MTNRIPDGVFPTMLTPFTSDNRIDYPAVEALLQWYTQRGVDGIFAICQSSEIFFLSFEERLQLLRFIMAHKPKDVCIVASGNVENDIKKQLDEAKRFADCGVDAYVFISNRLAAETEPDDVFLERLLKAADALDPIPLGIYECPYPYKRVLTPYVIGNIARSGRFAFIKDTCCSLPLIKEKLAAAENTGLKIYNANAATLLRSLKMGCAGYSGVMANFHPELYTALCRCYRTEAEKAERLQTVLGFLSVIEYQWYPVNAKYYLQLEGLPIQTFSRTKSDALLTESKKLEIEQMRALTNMLKSEPGLL
ncbi:MAG: dihydrodipicolinate synthase family protein [Clostridia bacterium]|nr:dihydrodipicolinate synthase family protein [Clostridia bacterium]